MLRSSAALFLTTLVSLILKINAKAITTPPSPTHHSLATSEELRRRQSGLNGTDYCWGDDGGNGICAMAFNLLQLCTGYIDDSDKTLYPKCFCGNGQRSTQQAWDQSSIFLREEPHTNWPSHAGANGVSWTLICRFLAVFTQWRLPAAPSHQPL